MTFGFWDDNISIVAWDLPCKDNAMERCPSGLRSWSWKPVTPQGAVGSNPTFSAVSTGILIEYRLLVSLFGEVPKRLKGLPWQGSRSLIAARGFKSLLLRWVTSKASRNNENWMKIKQQNNPENSLRISAIKPSLIDYEQSWEIKTSLNTVSEDE